jgi:hypothetical protein
MDRILKFGFIFFAIFAIVFGFIKISQTIKLSFPDQLDNSEISNEEHLDDIKLRVTDTDEDGLYDWDELNVFNTSPYLSDTDSDGISDSEEIDLGEDPNCPRGKVCGSDILEVVESIRNQETDTNDTGLNSTIDAMKGFSKESQEALSALEQGTIPTPDQIRSLLIDSGVSKEQLDETSDEDIVQLFIDTASEN